LHLKLELKLGFKLELKLLKSPKAKKIPDPRQQIRELKSGCIYHSTFPVGVAGSGQFCTMF
jgi:hypothetical protein